jgi:regulator of nonsense transcripts 2
LVVRRPKPTDYYECLCGIFLSGLVPKKIRLLAEQYQVSLPRSKLLTKEKQRNVKALLKDYYASLVKHVTKVRFDIMILGLMQ